MDEYLGGFRAIQSKNGKKWLTRHGLVCKVGEYGRAVVLKLLKQSWTNDAMDVVPNKTGLFFSIWLAPGSVEQGRVLYNIHALKLRQLKGYRIERARAFADAFRKRFRASEGGWPNVSLDYGPATLMEGWIELNPKTFKADTLGLMSRFIELCPTIDALLASHKIDEPA